MAKDSRDELPHPMQPIGLDEKGTPRFKENKIVSFLLHGGIYDLNKISMMPFPKEDYTQLMQLIGYSTSGYGDLSTSPTHLVMQADEKASNLLELEELTRKLEELYGMGDLDSHVHELKAQEASDINNSSFEEQVRYLIEHAGADWVRDALLDDPPGDAETVQEEADREMDCTP
jgi:hypothetical protein